MLFLADHFSSGHSNFSPCNQRTNASPRPPQSNDRTSTFLMAGMARTKYIKRINFGTCWGSGEALGAARVLRLCSPGSFLLSPSAWKTPCPQNSTFMEVTGIFGQLVLCRAAPAARHSQTAQAVPAPRDARRSRGQRDPAAVRERGQGHTDKRSVGSRTPELRTPSCSRPGWDRPAPGAARGRAGRRGTSAPPGRPRTAASASPPAPGRAASPGLRSSHTQPGVLLHFQ